LVIACHTARSFRVHEQPVCVVDVPGRGERFRDVWRPGEPAAVAAVAQPPLVAAPPRAQHVLGDWIAIEVCLENPVCGGVQGGSGDRAMTVLQAELRAQQRCSVEVLIGGNGYCRPGERHEFLSVGDHLYWLEP
jgi:hypothetical protein